MRRFLVWFFEWMNEGIQKHPRKQQPGQRNVYENELQKILDADVL